MPSVRLSRRARETLAGLPPALQAAVGNTIELLRADPWVTGKPLRGELRPMWSARVGSYRVLYTIEGTEQSVTVVVRAIRHRVVAYQRRRDA